MMNNYDYLQGAAGQAALSWQQAPSAV